MNCIPRFFCFFIVICFGQSLSAQTKLPEANAAIVKYVESVMGKKVDRGECWDLANQALKLVNAKWDGEFKYGKLLDPKKDTIFPGDIIQFKNVVIKEVVVNGNETLTTEQKMALHTAIVYQVNGQGDFMIVHQNTSFSGRKVGVSRLVLKYVKRGKIYIYRPVTEEE
jgi:hypothetical protein